MCLWFLFRLVCVSVTLNLLNDAVGMQIPSSVFERTGGTQAHEAAEGVKNLGEKMREDTPSTSMNNIKWNSEGIDHRALHSGSQATSNVRGQALTDSRRTTAENAFKRTLGPDNAAHTLVPGSGVYDAESGGHHIPWSATDVYQANGQPIHTYDYPQPPHQYFQPAPMSYGHQSAQPHPISAPNNMIYNTPYAAEIPMGQPSFQGQPFIQPQTGVACSGMQGLAGPLQVVHTFEDRPCVVEKDVLVPYTGYTLQKQYTVETLRTFFPQLVNVPQHDAFCAFAPFPPQMGQNRETGTATQVIQRNGRHFSQQSRNRPHRVSNENSRQSSHKARDQKEMEIKQQNPSVPQGGNRQQGGKHPEVGTSHPVEAADHVEDAGRAPKQVASIPDRGGEADKTHNQVASAIIGGVKLKLDNPEDSSEVSKTQSTGPSNLRDQIQTKFPQESGRKSRLEASAFIKEGDELNEDLKNNIAQGRTKFQDKWYKEKSKEISQITAESSQKRAPEATQTLKRVPGISGDLIVPTFDPEPKSNVLSKEEHISKFQNSHLDGKENTIKIGEITIPLKKKAFGKINYDTYKSTAEDDKEKHPEFKQVSISEGSKTTNTHIGNDLKGVGHEPPKTSSSSNRYHEPRRKTKLTYIAKKHPISVNRLMVEEELKQVIQPSKNDLNTEEFTEKKIFPEGKGSGDDLKEKETNESQVGAHGSTLELGSTSCEESNDKRNYAKNSRKKKKSVSKSKKQNRSKGSSSAPLPKHSQNVVATSDDRLHLSTSVIVDHERKNSEKIDPGVQSKLSEVSHEQIIQNDKDMSNELLEYSSSSTLIQKGKNSVTSDPKMIEAISELLPTQETFKPRNNYSTKSSKIKYRIKNRSEAIDLEISTAKSPSSFQSESRGIDKIQNLPMGIDEFITQLDSRIKASWANIQKNQLNANEDYINNLFLIAFSPWMDGGKRVEGCFEPITISTQNERIEVKGKDYSEEKITQKERDYTSSIEETNGPLKMKSVLEIAKVLASVMKMVNNQIHLPLDWMKEEEYIKIQNFWFSNKKEFMAAKYFIENNMDEFEATRRLCTISKQALQYNIVINWRKMKNILLKQKILSKIDLVAIDEFYIPSVAFPNLTTPILLKDILLNHPQRNGNIYELIMSKYYKDNIVSSLRNLMGDQELLARIRLRELTLQSPPGYFDLWKPFNFQVSAVKYGVNVRTILRVAEALQIPFPKFIKGKNLEFIDEAVSALNHVYSNQEVPVLPWFHSPERNWLISNMKDRYFERLKYIDTEASKIYERMKNKEEEGSKYCHSIKNLYEKIESDPSYSTLSLSLGEYLRSQELNLSSKQLNKFESRFKEGNSDLLTGYKYFFRDTDGLHDEQKIFIEKWILRKYSTRSKAN